MSSIDSDLEEEPTRVSSTPQAGVVEALSARSAAAAAAPPDFNMIETASVAGQGDSSSSVGKGSGKQNGISKGPKFRCRYDGHWHPMEEKIPGFMSCRTGKRTYDALEKLARKQGELAWWSEQKKEDKKLHACVRKYRDLCPDNVGRGRKRNSDGLKMSEMFESITNTTGLEKRAHGVMMWKEQYLMWAGSVEAGYIPRPTAEAKWNQWAQPFGDVPRDEEGPEHAPLRLWVHTADHLDGVASFMRQQGVRQGTGPVRNASEEQLSDWRVRVSYSAETVQGVGEVEMQGMAHALARSSASSSSSGLTPGISSVAVAAVNLRDTFIHVDGAEGDDATAAAPHGPRASNSGTAAAPSSQALGKGNSVGAPSPGPQAKKARHTYFEADRVNAANSARWQIGITAIVQEAGDVRTEMSSLLEGAKAKGWHTTAVFGGQLQLLQVRMDVFGFSVPTEARECRPRMDLEG